MSKQINIEIVRW